MTTESITAAKVATAESLLFQWACGCLSARDVQTGLRSIGVRLMDRLNPHGNPVADAVVDGCADVVTLRF